MSITYNGIVIMVWLMINDAMHISTGDKQVKGMTMTEQVYRLADLPRHERSGLLTVRMLPNGLRIKMTDNGRFIAVKTMDGIDYLIAMRDSLRDCLNTAHERLGLHQFHG